MHKIWKNYEVLIPNSAQLEVCFPGWLFSNEFRRISGPKNGDIVALSNPNPWKSILYSDTLHTQKFTTVGF